MTAGQWIAVGWLTFAVAVVTTLIWSFSQMGDCPAETHCERAVWLTPLIFVAGLLVWTALFRLILRKKP